MGEHQALSGEMLTKEQISFIQFLFTFYLKFPSLSNTSTTLSDPFRSKKVGWSLPVEAIIGSTKNVCCTRGVPPQIIQVHTCYCEGYGSLVWKGY